MAKSMSKIIHNNTEWKFGRHDGLQALFELDVRQISTKPHKHELIDSIQLHRLQFIDRWSDCQNKGIL